MHNRLRFIQPLLILLPMIALIPAGLLTLDWVRLSGLVGMGQPWNTPEGFDWVDWEDVDGFITAVYVFPNGPAAEGGVAPGDVLYELDYQQFFNAEDFKEAIEGSAPGTVRMYTLQRESELTSVDVRISRYPTFMYPLSTSLWYASIWGFTVGAFFHLLALIIVVPLAIRSWKAMLSSLLILTSSLWVLGNLGRMVLILLLGPPDVASGAYAFGFQFLTLISLSGWILFPVLLLQKVLFDLPEQIRTVRLARWLVWFPPFVLGVAALYTGFGSSIGPITLDALIGPVLFYVCCYIAAATGLSFLLAAQETEDGETPSGWSRAGSLAVFFIASLAALIVLDIASIPGSVSDSTAGWLIVSLQLLSLAPVGLISFATLKYGKIDHVLTRSLTYLFALGSYFFAFIGGMYLLEPYLSRVSVPSFVVTGLYGVVLLIVFERLGQLLSPYTRTYLTTDRQRARKRLTRFTEETRFVMDVQALGTQAIETVGLALDASTGILFLKGQGAPERWVKARYHPVPPYFTEELLALVWPHIEETGSLWMRNPELSDNTFPPELSESLEQHGAYVAAPVVGDRMPYGLLVLGPKRQRRAVYNLEDLDLLRSICSQLALAMERLTLVEREKELVRVSAEAQLVALRAQINPHFLFNTLNTIASLIEETPDKAEQTIEHLAAIFRHILHTGSQPFVSLHTELRLVDHYLAIEQARFEERLTVVQDLDPALNGLDIPAFAVQTLVENAVLHGIAKRVGGGTVRLTSRRTSPHMAEIRIADTGVGIPELFGKPPVTETAAFFGLGLRNVSDRLKKLYGRDDLMEVSSNPTTGTQVCMRIPTASPAGAHESAYGGTALPAATLSTNG